MATEVTVNMTRSTAGYVDPKLGLFTGIVGITANLNTGTNQPIANRNGLQLSIVHITSAANTNTWTSEIQGAVACAWQPEDATDDDVRVVISAYTASGERSRGGTVFTFVAGGTRAGWLWVLHRS